ncbi:Unknown protein [Striga hermonthica]|uniref:Zinc knuckle CX2CX4HX4C domain-containing protein n=1 Tax=Striga hermonthica TaxID=68872 RepID=A0A9N7N6V7_STRHE|nr:Unknown protein [Striga hermonthica]
MAHDLAEKMSKFALSEKEKTGVTLADSDIGSSLQGCELSLIGKIIVEEDKTRVLYGKTWSFDGQYLLLKEWKKNAIDFKDEDLKVELWVQIHKLPLHWISVETGMKIGRIFDKVLDVIVPGPVSYIGNVVKILVALNVMEPIPRGTIIKLGDEEHWVEFRYENLLTFCFYCGRIGHNDRICVVKKVDVQKNMLKSGQYGEWLRGSPGMFSEFRERRSSSPSSPSGERVRTESSKNRNNGDGDDQINVMPIVPIPYPTYSPEDIGVGVENGTGQRNQSPELVSNSNVPSPDIDKGVVSKEVGSILIEPMELDESKIKGLDLSNLVNVPVGQIDQKGTKNKNQRSAGKPNSSEEESSTWDCGRCCY